MEDDEGIRDRSYRDFSWERGRFAVLVTVYTEPFWAWSLDLDKDWIHVLAPMIEVSIWTTESR